MSTWRRQLSTFERSLISGSAISVISVIRPVVRLCLDEPCRRLLVENRRSGSAADGGGSLDAACQLLESGLQHRALRLCVGRELLQPSADVGLESRDPAVEPGHPVVALALERVCGLGEPPLEPLRSRVAHVGQPLGEDGLRLPREHLDGPVELAGEPAGGILAPRLYERSELLARLLRVSRRGALDDPLHLLELPALDVLEAGPDALHRLRLLALDPLEELPLASAHPLVELVQRPPPLRRVAVDLGSRRSERLLERAVDLGAQP